jgi:hypothetical protein
MLRGLTEWISPSGWSGFCYVLLVAVTVYSLTFARAEPSELMLLGLTFAGAAIAGRNLPLFAVVSVWVIGRRYGLVTSPLRRFRPVQWFDVSIAGIGGWLWMILVPAAVLLAGQYPASSVRFPLDLSQYPVHAVDWLAQREPAGNIFVREEWSGYMLWRFPNRRLFFDAKGGFSPAAMKDHSELIKPGPRWREVVQEYGISTFLLKRDSPLATLLAECPDWTLQYSDSLTVLYSCVSEGSADQARPSLIRCSELRDRQ